MYKFTDKDHKTVTNRITGASGIHPGVWQWEAYQEWKNAGGITEAFDTRTAEEILEADTIVLALQQRREAIKVKQDENGLKEVTVDEALAWLDNLIADANTTAKKFEAIRIVFRRMIPYLLD